MVARTAGIVKGFGRRPLSPFDRSRRAGIRKPSRHRQPRYTASGAQRLRWVSAFVDCGPAAADSHSEQASMTGVVETAIRSVVSKGVTALATFNRGRMR